MTRLFVFSVLLFGLTYGQTPERDTLNLNETEREVLLEGITAESGESEAVDVLEEKMEYGIGGFKSANVRVRTRLQVDRPYSNVRFPLGPPFKVYQRVLFEGGENGGGGPALRGGILTEKDAGERYADLFAAGYLEVVLPALGGRILAGDYAIESGKGLAFWRSSGITKGGDVLGPARCAETRIEPYRSTEENRFFRGIALEKNSSWFRISAFYSDKRLNASRNAEGEVTSLDTDGLFRTELELRNRRSVRETILGGLISARLSEGFIATVKGSRTSVSLPLSLSRYKDFHGTTASVLAADFTWQSETFVLSGEAARDARGSIALSSGLLVAHSKPVSVALAARIYPRSFNSLYGVPVSERGIAEGEEGMYLGVNIRPSRWLAASFFHDIYVFSNRFPFRSAGNDFLGMGTIKVDDRWELAVQYRRQSKPVLVHAGEGGLETLHQGNTLQERFRISLVYEVSRSVKWQARIEATVRRSENRANDAGYLAFQEMRWQILGPLRVSFRIAAFDTDNYDARIYVYEADVPGGFSNVPLWNAGLRTYFLAEWAMTPSVRITAKYSGSYGELNGVGEEAGGLRERMTIQCDASF